MIAAIRQALTIQPQETHQTPALADLIPDRARLAGCIDFEDFCDLIDKEATAHLTGVRLVRAARFRQMRRPRAYFDRKIDTHCLSVCLNNNRSMFAKAEAADWIAMQEAGHNGLWMATICEGRLDVVTRLTPNPEDAAELTAVAGLILRDLGPDQEPGFVDGDRLNLRRTNLFPDV
ncbi:hypothetical protein E4L95_15890 [Paracoccus liaowanqingii]|uniref:Uncharacterized protein n=1 Tax=Paracoccus liaowanqingii TaxID=2560053 RepID=A0A4Z1BXJ5_9RHOB|nr:hypothetical protein [Paracoccus liaowanqingii]TGN53779.1 hypothetical protein E4L95_15890 [Paracoccus liaowanqingii]